MTHSYKVHDVVQTGDILLLTVVPRRPGFRLNHTPGQYAAVGFKHHGRPTPLRCFSIVSTPGSEAVQFAMRVRGNFTQTAAALNIGDEVYVQGPFGEFTIDTQSDRSVVMLAAGIGITPFIAMLRAESEQESKLPITLLYSNRSATNIPFQEELRSLARSNSNLQIRFFITDPTISLPADADDCIAGPIPERYIQRLTEGTYAGSTYFVCGPSSFTDTMHDRLLGNSVHETRIVSESFTQTSKAMLGSKFSIRPLTYGLSAATLALATAFIMGLDLSRTVPRLVSAQAAATPNSTSVTQTKTNNSSSSSNSTSTPAQTSTPTTTYYQAPVSSVS